jgi:transcriptional regulator with XRE-family HTH domain
MIEPMNADERKAWGPLIREARKAQGLDQEALARMADTTRRTVGSIERGDTTGQPDVIRRILDALGLAPDPELDPDVRNFVALIGPLLQRLNDGERARLMPAIVELIADALKNQAPDTNDGTVLPFGRRDEYDVDEEIAAHDSEGTIAEEQEAPEFP